MTKKLLIVGIVLTGMITFAGCVRRPAIQAEYGPRLDAIEVRLETLESKFDSILSEVSKANSNDKILHENMEQLYNEVDELREKMGMSRSKPRKLLVK